ncbi:MAG TPA: ATP-binding protein, partial [bacterium]
ILGEEWVITRADGQERTLSISTSVLDTGKGDPFILAMMQDVTERKRSEQALRESEQQYRTTIDSMGNAIHVVDRNLRFVLFNKAFRDWNQRFHLKIDVIGKALFDVFPFLHESVRNEYARVFKSGRLLVTEESTKIEGREIFTETRKIPIIKDERVIQVATVVTDVTERKTAENALKKAHDAFRLASLGTLAAGVSHEINQPLTALKVKVDGMLHWGTENPDLLQKRLVSNLQFISDEADKIDRIIKHMRSLIRSEKQEPEPVDVNEAVRKSMSIIGQQMASHGILVQLKLDPDRPTVLAQAVSLEEVMVNLLSNALYALDQVDQEPKTITVTTRTSSKACFIDFEDNGPGVPESLLERIFEPLFTTRSAGQGMGLGLSIVQRLLEEYGGTIRAFNRSEGGAKFTVHIPLYEASHPEAS